MVVYGDYVYIFGGINHSNSLKVAERMKIGEWKWSKLPNMKESRLYFGVYLSENRIYLIGGRYNTSIEYFDIANHNFYSLPNIRVEGRIVCGVIDDLIYAVGKQHLRVFDKDLQPIQAIDHINNIQLGCYSDVIVKGSSFIYINNLYNKVYSFDSKSRSLRVIK